MAEPKTYRLQTLLKLRQRKKEDAERYLGDCIRTLRQEQQRQEEMEKELERMIGERERRRREYADQVMRGEMSAQGAMSAHQYIERLKELEVAQQEAIEGQKEVVARAEEDVMEARKLLAQATQELKALEKHKEKWQKRMRREQQAREEIIMDEVAQTIFLNQDDS